MDLVLVLDWPFHVEFPVSVIFLGAIVGLSYGLLATGLVLVYRAQRIINLAHAQLGVVGAAEQRPEIQDAKQVDAGAVVDAIDQRAVVAEIRARGSAQQRRDRGDE